MRCDQYFMGSFEISLRKFSNRIRVEIQWQQCESCQPPLPENFAGCRVNQAVKQQSAQKVLYVVFSALPYIYCNMSRVLCSTMKAAVIVLFFLFESVSGVTYFVFVNVAKDCPIWHHSGHTGPFIASFSCFHIVTQKKILWCFFPLW